MASLVRVFVTGTSSLIGAGVVDSLVRRGDEVVCFQRRAAATNADRAAIVERLGDVRDAAALADAAADCEAIVHVAARVGVVGSWEDFRSVNVDGTRNVIAAAQAHGITRIVHVSSPSVAHGGEPIVGAGADVPHTGRSHGWYAESKALAEIEALAAADREMGVVAVRPHLVWGPGDTQLVGRIVDRARGGRLALIGGGTALVDTTYIDNAVSALVASLDAVAPGARCSGRAYVIANGEPRTIRELVSGICGAAGVPFAPRSVPRRVGLVAGAAVERVWPVVKGAQEPPLTRFLAEQLSTAHWFDPRPARDDLGWEPTVTIDDGLRRLAAWYAR